MSKQTHFPPVERLHDDIDTTLNHRTTERTNIPPVERLQVRPSEAAQLLSISERELRRLTKSGEIPSIGRRRLRRYAVADLRAWQDRHRSGGLN